MQVLIIYLQYNFIASKLPLNWPTGLINFVGGIQIFFTSGEGIFSLDCLLQVLNFRVWGLRESARLSRAVPTSTARPLLHGIRRSSRCSGVCDGRSRGVNTLSLSPQSCQYTA